MGDPGTGTVPNGFLPQDGIDTIPQRPRVLNMGVVGIGRMGQVHALNILRSTPRARLVCACSPAKVDQDWAKQELVPYGVVVFSTFEEMINFPGLDAVVIASLTELHFEHTKEALKRRIHVLCEKPISQTVEQLQELISINKESPQTCAMVGFTRRFDENYQEAVEKIREGIIGSPVVIRSQGCEKLTDAPFMHSYVVNAAKGGGFFVDSFIHDIDLTLSFLEASNTVPIVKSVCALGTASHFKELGDAQLADADNAVGMVQFWSGQISFHYNSRTGAAGYDNQTEIFGTQGKISVNLIPRKNRLEISDTNGVHLSALPSWYDRYKVSFVTEINAFADAVLDQRPMPISLESCVMSLKIAQALQESMRTGLKLDFDENGERRSV